MHTCIGKLIFRDKRWLTSMLNQAHAYDWPADPFAQVQSYEAVNAGNAPPNWQSPSQTPCFLLEKRLNIRPSQYRCGRNYTAARMPQRNCRVPWRDVSLNELVPHAPPSHGWPSCNATLSAPYTAKVTAKQVKTQLRGEPLPAAGFAASSHEFFSR